MSAAAEIMWPSTGYRARSYLRFHRRTLVTQGVRDVVEVQGERCWSELGPRVRRLLHAAGDPGGARARSLVIGALPFDRAERGALVCPEQAVWFDSSIRVPHVRSPVLRLSVWDVGVERYRAAVADAVARIRSTDLKKVVLARWVDVRAAEPFDVRGLLGRLTDRNPGAYAFAVDIPKSQHVMDLEGAAHALVGASPELLVARSGREVTSNPLAGSLPRAADPREDARRSAGLLASAKNLREHAFVVEAVAEGLRPFCDELYVPRAPAVLGTDTMWHLSSRIRGRLKDPAVCALTLANALHPTPAVCGTPRGAALATIGQLEGEGRGLYAGMVGWCDSNGDGEWVVALRCGEIRERSMRVFAGAGIVRDSSPDDELAETSAKLSTMLCALGVRADSQAAG